MSRRAVAVAVGLLAAVLAAGCSGLPSPARRGGVEPRVLVVLPPAPPPVWRRNILELAAAHELYVYEAWMMLSLDQPCVVYGLRPGASLERAVRRLAADPRVESAQAVQRFEVLSAPPAAALPPSAAGQDGPPVPDAEPAPRAAPAAADGSRRVDPYAHLQHGLADLHAPEAHRWATGRGVIVAVVDTGIDVGHPDLAGRVERTGNFVDHDRQGFTRDVHGTAVAGVVAAVADNGIGIAGVAPAARLLAFKACWPRSDGEAAALCDSYTLAQAVDAAVAARADVLLLSLAGPRDELLARLLAVALERGAAVVAAVDEARPGGGFPASLAGVMAVRSAPPADGLALPQPAGQRSAGQRSGGAAADDEDRRAPPAAPLLAPGVDVLTTVPGGGYDFHSGSSLAAAHVAGVAALLLEGRPGLAPAELARRLAESARGSAIVDACAAVTRLLRVRDGCSPDETAAR